MQQMRLQMQLENIIEVFYEKIYFEVENNEKNKIVCSGAKVSCTMSPDISTLNVLSAKKYIDGKACATIYDNAIRDINYIALATNAVRSGIIAAHNACGTKLESIGVQGSNGISIYGLNMVSTGITEEKAKSLGIDVLSTSFSDLQKPGFMESKNEKVMIKIVYEKESRDRKSVV